MEVISISGGSAWLLCHPTEGAEVGQQFSLLEVPERTEGLVVQVISNDSLEYAGLEQEIIQRILERQIAQHTETPLDRERGMGEIKSLKVATAKIRKRIRQSTWQAWDGWIPTRNVQILRIEAPELLRNILPTPRFPVGGFASVGTHAIDIDGPGLEMVNVITGLKGSGKSHLAKHLVLALSQRGVPIIVFDINGEYVGLPGCQHFRWGENLVLHLGEMGYRMLEMLVKALQPLQPGSPSEAVFESQLPIIFRQHRERCEQSHLPFSIDIPHLSALNWADIAGGQGASYIASAIETRLDRVDRRNLFWRSRPRLGDAADVFYATRDPPSFQRVYERACEGHPVVFDMRDIEPNMQRALVSALMRYLEEVCEQEARANGRYPAVFFEEAHFYMDEDATLNMITRGRHIGICSFFVTNTPDKLPESVFRQLDNLFLLGLSHKDDIRIVSKNSFTDEDTIQAFATRMPEHHALIVGDVTDRYPLVVEVQQLPPGVPLTGQTRSTWDRFAETH